MRVACKKIYKAHFGNIWVVFFLLFSYSFSFQQRQAQASCSWLPQPQLKFAIAALLTVHETALLDNRDSFAASEASFATSFLEVKIFLLCYDLKLAMMALPAICQLGKL